MDSSKNLSTKKYTYTEKNTLNDEYNYISIIYIYSITYTEKKLTTNQNILRCMNQLPKNVSFNLGWKLIQPNIAYDSDKFIWIMGKIELNQTFFESWFKHRFFFSVRYTINICYTNVVIFII